MEDQEDFPARQTRLARNQQGETKDNVGNKGRPATSTLKGTTTLLNKTPKPLNSPKTPHTPTKTLCRKLIAVNPSNYKDIRDLQEPSSSDNTEHGKHVSEGCEEG